MAFNPFASFRKHQKYWMAGAVLVCMFTFVLCSGGIKGTGLDDMIINLTRRRGSEYAKINNRGYTHEDLSELKNQRNIANDFMRELTKVGYDRMLEVVKRMKAEEKGVESTDKRRQQSLAAYNACLEDLGNKYTREPRYFRGGGRLEDLVEFILWRDLADKYNVQLSDDVVKELVMQAVHANGQQALWLFDTDTSSELQHKVRATHNGATDAAIVKSLREEFRVQIIQLAYLSRWSPGKSMDVGQGMTYSERDIFGENYRLFLNTPMQYRIVPTPEQISAHYRKVRTELTVELLPVSLEVLAKKVEIDPATKMKVLEEFYNKYKTESYNPTLETPGFGFPATVEIQYILAEPTMDYYRLPAETAFKLEKAPAVAFNPLNPLAGQIQWLAALPAWQASLQTNLDAGRADYEKKLGGYYDQLRQYNAVLQMPIPEELKTEDRTQFLIQKTLFQQKYEVLLNSAMPPYKYGLSPLTTPYIWNAEKYNEAEAKPNAWTVAITLANLAAPDAALTALAYPKGAAYAEQLKQIQPMVVLDKNKRIKAGSELLLAHTPDLFGGGPFTAAGMTYFAALQPQYEPITGYLEAELSKKIEENLAHKWMNVVMLDCKKQLERVKGREEAFREQLRDLRRKYSRDILGQEGKTRTVSGLEFHETAKLRNQFDIDEDPDLLPLLGAFDKWRHHINMVEGRGGKAEMLRQGDFHKLFFSTEPLGIGGADIFVPKVWPPYVSPPKQLENPFLTDKSRELRFFDKDEKPIIFWKSVKRASETQKWDPTDTRKVEFAEMQYRMFTARNKLMDEVEKIADIVRQAHRKEGKTVPVVMREMAEKHGTQVITLENVAQLVENKNRRAQDSMNYVEYTLKRDKVPYAREDMVKDLLALHNLTKPLKIDDTKFAKLNELNEKLFDRTIKPGIKLKVGQEEQVLEQVQVLTNKPRSVYYIAMVTKASEPEMFHYYENVLPQAAEDKVQNMFVDQVQTEYGKELLRLTVQQLRDQAEVYISDEAKKQFADADQGTQ